MPEWGNYDQGDPEDWLTVCKFLLKSGTEDDEIKIRQIIGAIGNNNLRLRLVEGIEALKDNEKTLEKFTELFEKFVEKGSSGYGLRLKNLKYRDELNMADFYANIKRWTARMLNLEVGNTAVDKMARITFMEKLPREICEAMLVVDWETENIVEIAERVKNMRRSMKRDDATLFNKMTFENGNHQGSAGYSGNSEQNMGHGYGNMGYAGQGYGNMGNENYRYGNMGYSGNNYSGYYNGNQFTNRNEYGYWNGNGQGYRGYCWNCGASGHKQWECNVGQNNMEYNQMEIEQGPVVEEPKETEETRKDEDTLFNSLFE